ncbi:MAG: hypothetical protein FD188_3336 [Ignavibacteria bacterium]|nr:MAG: hypothetical protein FD188_3336 [Ignavibacteria bacterium]
MGAFVAVANVVGGLCRDPLIKYIWSSGGFPALSKLNPALIEIVDCGLRTKNLYK